LQKTPVALLDGEAIYAGYTPEESRSESAKVKFAARVELADELVGATEIVVASPMWNWAAPAPLKAYIDAIIIPGVLAPGDGKLYGKKVTILISQGGRYTEGSGKEGWDFLTKYLQMVFEALGSKDVQTIFSDLGLAGIAPGMEGLVDAKNESIAAARALAVARANTAARPMTAK